MVAASGAQRARCIVEEMRRQGRWLLWVQAMTSHLRPLLGRGGLLLVGLCMGCGEGAADYEPPRLPPPPPPAPVVEPAAAPEPYSQEPSPPPSAPPPQSSAPTDSAPAAPPPGQASQGTQPPAPPPSTPPPAAAQSAEPSAPSAPRVYTYPSGQWVYLSGRGWVWVPAGASTVEMEGAPYVYLYTPAYGWTWYLSPWGVGPYHYGVWVRHPWHPYGWHGYWVAHPRVVVRLGRGHYRRW